MSAQEHKDLVKKYAEEVWTQGRIEAADKYVAAITFVMTQGFPSKYEGRRALSNSLRCTALPSRTFTSPPTTSSQRRTSRLSAGMYVVRTRGN